MMPSGKPVCIALNGPSFYRKNVDLSGIKTRILGLKGEHADYYEQFTTTAREGVQIVQMDPFSTYLLVNILISLKDQK